MTKMRGAIFSGKGETVALCICAVSVWSSSDGWWNVLGGWRWEGRDWHSFNNFGKFLNLGVDFVGKRASRDAIFATTYAQIFWIGQFVGVVKMILHWLVIWRVLGSSCWLIFDRHLLEKYGREQFWESLELSVGQIGSRVIEQIEFWDPHGKNFRNLGVAKFWENSDWVILGTPDHMYYEFSSYWLMIPLLKKFLEPLNGWNRWIASYGSRGVYSCEHMKFRFSMKYLIKHELNIFWESAMPTVRWCEFFTSQLRKLE